MAKKRSRKHRRVNLGGSPVEHLREAREAIKWVGKKLREAEGRAKAGTCSTALFSLTNARRELGRAQGTLVGQEGWSGDALTQKRRLRHHLDRLDRVSFNVAKTFINHCVGK